MYLKKLRGYIFSILASTILLTPSFAQTYTFRHIGSGDGLTSNSSMCCIQDDFGFIWVATKDGIFRYDGFEFDALSSINPNAYHEGKIFKLALDNEGIIWFSSDNKIGYYNTRTNDSGIKDVIPTGTYYSICPDKEGNIWIAGTSRTIRFSKKDNSVSIFDIKMDQSSQALLCGSDGTVWATSIDNCLLRFDKENDQFEPVYLNMGPCSDGAHPVNLAEMGDGIFIISDNLGQLYKFDSRTERLELFSRELMSKGVNYVLAKSIGEYWIGTPTGIYIIDGNGRLKSHIRDNIEYELSNCNIISMFQDREGNIWVCTYHGGINLWNNQGNGLTIHPITSVRKEINGRIVRAISNGGGSEMWIGTEDGGLCTYFPATGEIKDIGALNNFPEYNFQSLLLNGREMWAGTFGNGILKIDITSGLMTGRIDLPNNSVTYLFRSLDNKIYAGTQNGLFVYDNASDSFVKFEETSGLFVHNILEDSYGTIWIGCFGQGLWQKRNSSDSFVHVLGTNAEVKIKSDFVTSLFEDDSHTMWVSTEGTGVFHFQIGDDIVPEYIMKDNGLPSNISCAVIQDRNGNIWVSTTMGLVKLDSEHKAVQRIFLDHGTFLSSSFCHNARCINTDGIIYLGTYNGWLSFDPEDLSTTISRTPVYIKDVVITRGSQNVQLHEEGKSTFLSNEITIKKKDASSVNLFFCAPTFSSLSTPRYAYTIKGNGTNISSTTTSNNIVLNNLSSGKYDISVSEVGEDTDTVRNLKLRIKPSFFGSLFAIILYCLLGAFGLFFFMRQMRQRRSDKEKLVISEIESSKQKEIYDAKVSFFSFITHELRTPLTLIKLPIDKIIADKKYSPEIKDDILTISANTDKLIDITNQFLEMKKLDDNKMNFNFMNADICKVVKSVYDYFCEAGKARGLDFKLMLPFDSKNISTVPEAINRVLTNMVSAALRICEKRVGVRLEQIPGKEELRLRVNCDGALINDEQAGYMFDQFYPLESGNANITGGSIELGLPMAKNIAIALGGSLSLDRAITDRNSFVFTFPAPPTDPSLVTEAELKQAEALEEEAYAKEEESSGEGLSKKILIVEDDIDLRCYIAKELGHQYKTLVAGNGQEALDIINKEKVDMVISDIMMPVMNGCELCEVIKSNIESCHIPVILLTAVAGSETRISSLKAGADHYIEKPFSIDLLKASIQSLFNSRELMYKQFSESPLTHFNTISSNKIDQEFMDNLHSVIIEHLSDENLDIDSLTEIMRTSKSTLYRKVKANTGQKVNEYIKIFRLKKAAELLAEGKYRINEVAYLTGFSSASYFATSFLKQFNISPSNFVKSIKNSTESE